MKLSLLNEIPASRDMIDVFKGYNHNLRIGEGEFYDMKNLTSTNYPIISPRPNRGLYVTTEETNKPQGLICKDNLCFVAGSEFVINEHPVEMGLSTKAEDCPKTLISMGAYVIILPDKKWIKTIANKDDETVFEYGNIEALWDNKESQVDVTFQMCKVDGNAYDECVISDTAPEITEAMKDGDEDIPLWLDTSGEVHSLKQYSTSMAMWTTIATTYIKISAKGIGEYLGIGESFEVNDGVTISGIKDDSLKDLNNTMIVCAKDKDYIVVTGVLDKVITQTYSEGVITVSRKMPEMDFVIESENRLWGCRYGVANNGEVVNEIYASKLGDFKNWNCFAGISSDSYAATVGTDGQFTGAITHLGYPLFFKENCMHKVYGNMPSNYQIKTTACRGVQKGSHKSLAIVGEVLYYKSRSAICAYDGSLPQEISTKLGDTRYSNAVAESHGNKYYVSMHNDIEKDIEKGWELFVCDTAKALWHKEDDLRAIQFCSCNGQLYYIDYKDPTKIKTMFGGKDEKEYFEWMAETGIIGTDSPDKKYISKLNVRMSLDIGSRVFFFIEYDSCGHWDFLFRMDGGSFNSFTIPIKPKRCDHMRLRIEGNGGFRIYSISKTIERGSDL